VESFGALAQMNGASSVMATLWPVADEATASIMQSFYTHMVQGKMTKADALRAAQIEAIHGMKPGTGDVRGALSLAAAPMATASPTAPSSHPYFWSPFVLMGNWM
jgi:CHAT domain-containing protein